MQLQKYAFRPCGWITIMAGFLLAGCGSGSDNQSAPLTEVVAVTIAPQQIELTTELPGRTTAYLVAEIRPQVSGIIQKRLFREGSEVNAGEILYQIDPAQYRAAYDSAKASLARAQANLPAARSRAERYRELLAANAVSQQNFDDADAAAKQAEADVQYWKAAAESARINLEYTRITAPISGRIGKSTVTEGALVTANQPAALATVQQFNPIYVDVSQSAGDLLRMKHRMENGNLDQNGVTRQVVKLVLDDGNEYALTGELEFRDVTVDPSTGSVTLRAVFPNPDFDLLPGMFVRAIVQEGIDKQAILVPQQAVSRDPKGQPLTLVVDAEGIVQQKQLVIDRAIGDQWLLSSGLAAGERVIIEGVQKVRSGMPVKVVTTGAADSAPPEAEEPAPSTVQPE